MDDDLRWELDHGVSCAFSTVADGDLRDQLARRAWLERVRGEARAAVLRQVHGTVVVEADPARTPAADAQVTRDPTLALVAFGADCPGLCVAAPDVLGIAHCGWRGTAGGIVGALVAAVGARSAYTAQAFAALIGPGVAEEDYEVDAPVLKARGWPSGCLRPSGPGRARLDLAEAIAADLRAAGVGRIRVVDVRTSADPRLWSYRKRGGGLVQGLVAWRHTGLDLST